ncbi:MAG TPA: NAD(P)-dependent alcohol dehydrogenase [Candidatus Angelobacter sp.]|nr:NAD(P)-dependent alcohol dehydrogenase [Candidatus Angelobacter sp.]
MTDQRTSSPTRTMLAAQRDRYGPPEVVELRHIEVPTPKEGQVLVRLTAASVNRADLDGLKPRPGFARLFMGLRTPRNPGIGTDAAGIVEEVGPGVTRLKPGDEVMGDMFIGGQGSFAEYVCAPERAFQPIPPGMSLVEASTLPHSAILALQGLRRRDRTIQPGDRVLVDGASGNVGPFAVQIAKAMGAEVTGVASTDKLDLVRSLGADHVVDYTAVDYTKGSERYDWILDTDTHHFVTRVRRALKPNGVYVTLGGETGDILGGMLLGPAISRFGGRWSGLMLWWKPMHPPDVDRLKELIADGMLKPVIERTYPLGEVVAALRHVEDGRARGKVVITMDEAER